MKRSTVDVLPAQDRPRRVPPGGPSTQLMHAGGGAQERGRGPGLGFPFGRCREQGPPVAGCSWDVLDDIELYLQEAGMITSVLCILSLFKFFREQTINKIKSS